jgi:serine/threonine protein kinase
MQSVLHEAGLMRALTGHPNIVRIEEHTGPYIVMEHLSGGCAMGGSCVEPPLPEMIARRYFRDALLGLEHMHQKLIVHLDLKPQNMVIGRDGLLKLVDFGTSKRLIHAEELVAPGTGTPMFWAPECSSSDPCNGQLLDVWALGAVLYQFLTGTIPFMATTQEELVHKLHHTEPVYGTPFLSADAGDLLQSMLCKAPEKRASVGHIKHHAWVEMLASDPAEELNEIMAIICKEEEGASATQQNNNLFDLKTTRARLQSVGIY